MDLGVCDCKAMYRTLPFNLPLNTDSTDSTDWGFVIAKQCTARCSCVAQRKYPDSSTSYLLYIISLPRIHTKQGAVHCVSSRNELPIPVCSWQIPKSRSLTVEASGLLSVMEHRRFAVILKIYLPTRQQYLPRTTTWFWAPDRVFLLGVPFGFVGQSLAFNNTEIIQDGLF